MVVPWSFSTEEVVFCDHIIYRALYLRLQTCHLVPGCRPVAGFLSFKFKGFLSPRYCKVACCMLHVQVSSKNKYGVLHELVSSGTSGG